MANLALGTSALTHGGSPGAETTATIPTNGLIRIKLWGAGGGAGPATALAGNTTKGVGGGGGFVDATFSVQAGDTVAFYAAGGGMLGANFGSGGQSSRGGAGNPGTALFATDGFYWSTTAGFGGANPSTSTRNGAGGGGASYFKINGVYMAIAGGGGGGQSWDNTVSTSGGGGGGAVGEDGTSTGSGIGGAGGSQVAGGASGGGVAARVGGAMIGGNGSDKANSTLTPTTANPGGGGGQGWFGGGGGFGNTSVANSAAPGGGGSSYINTGSARYISTQSNVRATSYQGAGTADANYANDGPPANHASVAMGGTRDTLQNRHGGNGRVVCIYSLASAGNASGAVGTIPTTAPEFGVQVGVPEGVIGTITPVDPPEAGATGEGAAYYSDNGATLGMMMQLGGQGVAEAVVTIQVADDPITLFAPDGFVSVPFDGNFAITPQIALTAPNGVARVATSTLVTLETVTLTPPDGFAEYGVEVFSPLETLVLSVPTVSPTAEAANTSALPGPITLVSLRPGGAAESGPDIFASFATSINLTALDALAENGTFVTGDLYGANLLVNAPQGIAGLAGIAIPPTQFPFQYYARITFGTFLGDGHAVGLANSAAYANDIALTAPDAVKEFVVEAPGQAFVNDIVLTAPEGIENGVDAFGGAIPAIVLTAPVGIENATNAYGLAYPNDIVLSAPLGLKENVVDAIADLANSNAMINMYTIPAFGYGWAHGEVSISGVDELSSVILTASDASAGGGKTATMMLFDPNFIQLYPPDNVTKFSAKLFITILPAKITLVTPSGHATQGLDQIAVGDMDPVFILMQPPTGYVEVQPQAKWPPIELDVVDGYVDQTAPLRWKRSWTPGATPSLVDREMAINEFDGVLYTRDASGAVRPTPYVGFAKGRFAPDGGAAGQVLGVDGVWKAPISQGELALLLPPESGKQVFLTSASTDIDAVTPVIGRVYYHPFFLPQPTTISSLAVEVVADALATTHLGVCAWNAATNQPGATEVSGQVSAASPGVKTVAVSAVLATGWHAAMLCVTGQSGGSYRGLLGATTLDAAFAIVGDAYATFGTDLAVPPPVEGFATTGWSVLQAGIA